MLTSGSSVGKGVSIIDNGDITPKLNVFFAEAVARFIENHYTLPPAKHAFIVYCV